MTDAGRLRQILPVLEEADASAWECVAGIRRVQQLHALRAQEAAARKEAEQKLKDAFASFRKGLPLYGGLPHYLLDAGACRYVLQKRQEGSARPDQRLYMQYSAAGGKADLPRYYHDSLMLQIRECCSLEAAMRKREPVLDWDSLLEGDMSPQRLHLPEGKV